MSPSRVRFAGAIPPSTWNTRSSRDAAASRSWATIGTPRPGVETNSPIRGIELLDARESGAWEPHDHGDEHGADHDRHHHEDGEREVNAHVWLDPINAQAMTRMIATELSKIDPGHVRVYAANAEATIADLSAPDGELRKTLEPVRDRPFVVFHDAYQYFERRYDLNAVGSITVSPDRKPSAKRLAEIRAKLKGLNAACVFAEPRFEPALIDTVIEGTNAKRSKLDPEGATIEERPGLPTALLRNNAAALVDCLK